MKDMKKMQKGEAAVYGVYGLMEFMLRLPGPGSGIEVHFSGGQMSGYGVVPATFRTSDPILCRIIEKTSEFKKGKIRLLNS